jgi:hypothetical protein
MEQHTKKTTIDLPQSVYDFITRMINEGKEKSLRDMFLKLIDIYRWLDIGSWRLDDGILQTHMVRWIIMSDADMRIFEEHLTAEERHDVGLTIGKMWAEAWNARARTWDGDLTKRDNWNHVVETWKVVGWGSLDFNEGLNRIRIIDSLFSVETIAGVLEGLIGRTIKEVKSHSTLSHRIYAFDIGPRRE